ncbi:MAG: 50S ribosomal protein L21 [Candidatus Uhrbacteria bacterium GW2011_GWF2_41_16]|uniref:Large ribosomal subunit protein bL21 n=2 Tax=Candidatus Uhriibacteriota TaxID=1752732 RepID=A0A0G0YAZ8_9BACT|nr:MAG: 50S ribosomal protein L21 [Candidatus Uhrbacteria bacterium GW2011_GWC2_41_11]KKR97487.1 MAG: 50S ribosomal protein L21 [Candidatus Uhrbacteria bacterium GW2011_GWF2_41_16]
MYCMFAIIRTGGKQYEVQEGQELKIEKLELEVGATMEFDVLLLADEEGKDVKVGTPLVSGAKVKAKVLEHGKADKVSVVKYKAKSRYRRNVGHRQPFTKIKIEKITA